MVECSSQQILLFTRSASDAILYSSSSDESEESANETKDAEKSNMDLSHDNPNRDEDDA
nr:hypothetical protein [Tanacetum cinerariifolium]